jgi:capsular polysaccharide biosynthesis protein
MELRAYWQVVVDRIWVVVATFLVVLVVAAASVYAIPAVASPWQASISLAIKPVPLPANENQYYSDDYYSYVASEYLNDDLIDILQGDTFLQAARQQAQQAFGTAPNGSITAKKAHRVLDIVVSASNPTQALDLAKTIGTMLTDPKSGGAYFGLLSNRAQTVAVVDGPRITAQPAGRNALVNLAARALVGLALGVGLAFLLEYMDDSLRPSEVEELLGWPVLAEIPGRGVPAGRSGGRPTLTVAPSANGQVVK